MPLTRSYQDEKGTEREYEMILILKPNLSENEVKAIVERIMGFIDKYEGRLISLENWGKRTLAYTIKKHNQGIYLYWRIMGHFDLIPNIERLCRMIESIIRYMTIKIDDSVDPAARPETVKSEDLEDILSKSEEVKEENAEKAVESDEKPENQEE